MSSETRFNTSGRCVRIGAVKQIPTKKGTMSKMAVVLMLDEDGDYPQTIEAEVIGKGIEYVDQSVVGQRVKLTLDIRGREWHPPDGGETKVFNTLSLWSMEAEPGQSRMPQPQRTAPVEADDDVPF